MNNLPEQWLFFGFIRKVLVTLMCESHSHKAKMLRRRTLCSKKIKTEGDMYNFRTVIEKIYAISKITKYRERLYARRDYRSMIKNK